MRVKADYINFYSWMGGSRSTFSEGALKLIFNCIESECPDAWFCVLDIHSSFREVDGGKREIQELRDSGAELLTDGKCSVVVDRTCGIFNQRKELWE